MSIALGVFLVIVDKREGYYLPRVRRGLRMTPLKRPKIPPCPTYLEVYGNETSNESKSQASVHGCSFPKFIGGAQMLP